MTKEELEAKLTRIPDKPGVYLMKDELDRIIYIGKAKSLIKRVRSYFRASGQSSLKTSVLVDSIADLDIITTDSEVEALMLESNLIKEHQPHFNIILKDDKHFPFLRLTMEEDFPRLLKARRVEKDGSAYFGPYIPEGDANRTMSLVKKLFPLRRCSGPVKPKPRPCLHFEIGQCSSPCTGKITREDYREIVRQVRLFLDGRTDDLVSDLELKMKSEAEELRFEEAIRMRDRIRAVRNSFRRQKIISTGLENRDVIGLAAHDDLTVVDRFIVRKGKVLGRLSNIFESQYLSEDEVLHSYLIQAYREASLIPSEILLPRELEDHSVIEEFLTRQAERKVSLSVPKRGKPRDLMRMAQRNAELAIKEALKKRNSDSSPLLMDSLATFCGRSSPPNRIEAFDISNIGGVVAVASLVVWEGDDFNRKLFRRFKIQTVMGSNDLKMMEEVVERRFRRLVDEDSDFPDIVLLDGGRSQVATIARLFENYGFESVTLLGIAKGRSKRRLPREKRPLDYDYLVFPDGREVPASEIPEQILHFFQRMRDEAHRFAIEYHRKLRGQINFKSVLDEIPGVGPRRKRLLFSHFGSLQKVMAASAADLATVKGVDTRTAETIYNFFRALSTDQAEEDLHEGEASNDARNAEVNDAVP